MLFFSLNSGVGWQENQQQIISGNYSAAWLLGLVIPGNCNQRVPSLSGEREGQKLRAGVKQYRDKPGSKADYYYCYF